MKKISIILLLLVCIFGCNKKETTPDNIDFAIATRIERNGAYTKGIDSVRIWVYDSNKLFYLKTFTDSNGVATISLKKDSQYYVYFLTPTYINDSIVYYYTKYHPIISSVSNNRGKEEIVQKDYTETFIVTDTTHGYGYSKIQRPDPSYQ